MGKPRVIIPSSKTSTCLTCYLISRSLIMKTCMKFLQVKELRALFNRMDCMLASNFQKKKKSKDANAEV